MRTGDIIHGFKVNKESVVADIGATLFELTHIKTGAPLFFIDRDDENQAPEPLFRDWHSTRQCLPNDGARSDI